MIARRMVSRTPAVRVVVRRAQSSDLPAINAIEQAAFTDPWPASAFKEALASEHLYFSVGVDPAGAVVGYVVGWFAGGEGEIANIAVACEARGHGIGGQLLDEAIRSRRAAACLLPHARRGCHCVASHARRCDGSAAGRRRDVGAIRLGPDGIGRTWHDAAEGSPPRASGGVDHWVG